MMIKKFEAYINESVFYKKGDVVYVNGHVDAIDFHHRRGIVLLDKEQIPPGYENTYDYLILFDEDFDEELHDVDGKFPEYCGRCYFVTEDVVIDEKEMKKREELRLKNYDKYKDIDPYGEENWGEFNEGLKHKDQEFEVGDEVSCKGSMMGNVFRGEIGKIIYIQNEVKPYWAKVLFPTKFKTNFHGPTGREYDFYLNYLTVVNPEKKRRKKKKKRRIKIKNDGH